MQNVCVLVPRKMSIINSVACWIFYVQYLFGNFYLNVFLAAIVLRSIQYLRLTVHAFGR